MADDGRMIGQADVLGVMLVILLVAAAVAIGSGRLIVNDEGALDIDADGARVLDSVLYIARRCCCRRREGPAGSFVGGRFPGCDGACHWRGQPHCGSAGRQCATSREHVVFLFVQQSRSVGQMMRLEGRGDLHWPGKE